MIAAFDSLARQHAKEMDEAQETIAKYQTLCDDLLAALLDLVEQIEAIGIPEWSGAEGLCLAQARAAIAKAEG